MRNRIRGFSLIDVFIFLAIAALVASLLVPVLQLDEDRENYAESVILLKDVARGMEKHYLERGVYPVFTDWPAVAATDSPLHEYVSSIPTEDPWGRPFKIEESTDSDYKFKGFGAPGRNAVEYPDFTYSTNIKFKKKGAK